MLLGALVTILILTLFLYITYRKKRLPGPWNLPVIGYIHKLDPVAPYLTLTKLAQKYGPVYGIKLGMTDVAVVADGKILRKILAKNETLERPPLYMLNTVFQGKGNPFRQTLLQRTYYYCRSRLHEWTCLEKKP